MVLARFKAYLMDPQTLALLNTRKNGLKKCTHIDASHEAPNYLQKNKDKK